MARNHSRSPAPTAKRIKVAHVAAPEAHLSPSLLLDATVEKLRSIYVSNTPFKYAIIESLFQDDLLKQAKDECISELRFTEKETDIYKVNQTGDLASLSYLTEDQLAQLPSLLTLRDTLYSEQFRTFIRKVTGCGPLSGTKQDMSVNTYTKGCHLLNHDDVIGSRRVSYILYMPLPIDLVWQREWGGALELYPTVESAEHDGVSEPLPIPLKSIPPSWNQFIFFEVQPGKSFHSVEEVVVGADGDGRQRLSISGWFHAAQLGEEGYEPPTAENEAQSSRDQLTSTSTVLQPYTDMLEPQELLSDEQITFLSGFLNPIYLQPQTMESLAERFAEESSLELHSFLTTALAEALQKGLRDIDVQDGLCEVRNGKIPPPEAGTSGAWKLKGPPHKWRYCTLKPQSPSEEPVASGPDEIIQSLQNGLFPSQAFRAWLLGVSRLLPLSSAIEARRFRPGLDYTLATSDEREARLDVVLGLTPGVTVREDSNSEEAKGWSTGEWGGWECYMAPNEDDDDPAVYRSGPTKNAVASGSNNNRNSHGDANRDVEIDDDEDMDDTEDDGSTLLTVQPGFNRLLLVLRDQGVMRLVKYVSAVAEGSRWDICGEYEVGMVEIDDDDEDDDDDD